MASGVKTYTDDDGDTPIAERQLEDLYAWVDQVPLSRPKRNINRDFSDGVMVAELVKFFLPSIVQLHNYNPCNSTKTKIDNWQQLNRKVFKKLNFMLTEDLIRDISIGKPNVVERFLLHLRGKIDRAVWDMKKESQVQAEKAQHQRVSNARLNRPHPHMINDKPEADQNIVSPGRKAVPQAGPYKGARIKMIDETVPRAVYEEKEQECLAKEETIQILQAKVRRLEHLLHLKDLRIDDLQNRLETTRPTGLARR